MDNDYMEVVQHVNEYFEKHLPRYTVLEVRRQSYFTEKDYLYMVAGKNQDDGSYAVWMSWNDRINSLNFGHYNLPDLEECAKIMSEYQTCDAGYNENSSPLEFLCMLLVKNDDSFENSYHELLYIRGYADGITAQQEHNWDKMTDTEVRTLLQKAVEE